MERRYPLTPGGPERVRIEYGAPVADEELKNIVVHVDGHELARADRVAPGASLVVDLDGASLTIARDGGGPDLDVRIGNVPVPGSTGDSAVQLSKIRRSATSTLVVGGGIFSWLGYFWSIHPDAAFARAWLLGGGVAALLLAAPVWRGSRVAAGLAAALVAVHAAGDLALTTGDGAHLFDIAAHFYAFWRCMAAAAARRPEMQPVPVALGASSSPVAVAALAAAAPHAPTADEQPRPR